MKYLLALLALLTLSCASVNNRHVPIADGPPRMTNFKIPPTVNAGDKFQVSWLMAGKKIDYPICVWIKLDGADYGMQCREPQSRLYFLNVVIKEEYYMSLKGKRWSPLDYDDPIQPMPPIEGVDETQVKVKFEVEMWYAEPDEIGKLIPIKQMFEKKRTIRLDCMQCSF